MADNFEQQYSEYFENQGEITTQSDQSTADHSPSDSGDVESQVAYEIDISNKSNDESATDEQSQTESQPDNETTEETSEEETDTGEQDESDSKKDIASNLKAALKEERTKRQDLEKQFKTQQQESQQIKEALKELLSPQQQQQQQQAPQEQPPSYEDDPVAFLKWKQEQIYKNQQQQQQYLNQQKQTQQTYHEAVSLDNEYMQQKQEYAKENPDFDNAAKFLESSVINEYKALGYDDQQAAQLLIEDKLGLIKTAKQKQLSAPQLVEQIAQARGYTPQSQQNKSKLETVQKGMKNSKSLGSSGGDTSSKRMSLDELSRLNDDEFEKVFDQYAKGSLQVY